jgi:hypothetical protein
MAEDVPERAGLRGLAVLYIPKRIAKLSLKSAK